MRKPKKGQSLAEKYPELDAQWHPTKNGELTAFDISYGSTKKVWWKCDKGDDHVYLASPNKRSHGRGCPCCSGYQVVPSNSLAVNCKELLKEWDFDKNTSMHPTTIYWRTHKKAYWKCHVHNDHRYEMSVHKRTAEGYGCPFCSGARVAPSTSLEGLYPKLSKSWHPIKNKLKPSEIAPKSNQHGFWKCLKFNKGDNYWKATPNSRTKTDNPICPFCSGKKLAYDGENSIQKLYPKISNEFSCNNKDNSNQVTIYSRSKKYKWNCNEGHEYNMSVQHRLNGHGCTICSGKTVTYETSLKYLFPELSKEYDDENLLKSCEISPGSSIKVSWKCLKNSEHVWLASPNNRTKSNTPTGCPGCSAEKLVGETKLFELLKVKFPLVEINRQFSPSWLGRQHLDIYFPEYNIAVEYNGEQHYKPIEHWGGELAYYETVKRDQKKASLCKKNLCKLFVIRFDDRAEKMDSLVESISRLIDKQ